MFLNAAWLFAPSPLARCGTLPAADPGGPEIAEEGRDGHLPPSCGGVWPLEASTINPRQQGTPKPEIACSSHRQKNKTVLWPAQKLEMEKKATGSVCKVQH